MQKKQGISLIVLVITIIVMIILAASVVISLTSNSVLDRASQAVDLTDAAQVQDLAAIIWADAYLDPDKKTDIVEIVKQELIEAGIKEDKWNIEVTTTGVKVTKLESTSEESGKKPQKNTVITIENQDTSGGSYAYSGQTIAFEDVEINTIDNKGSYPGFIGVNATYNDCVINGSLALYSDTTFTNCEFNISGDLYNIWTWGATNLTFENCTFYSDGKAILMYGGTNTTLTVNNCIFYDKGGLPDLKAAIEIGNDYNMSYNLIVNNTVVNGYEINNKGINTGTTLWGNKNSIGTDKLNVVVDGVDVY